MFLKVHFFNWTNPEELNVRGKKPHFDQLGPYCFREVRQKENIKFHHENKTVSYFQRKLWYFDAECSNGSLKDVACQLDVVATSAAHKVRYWDITLQKSLSYLLSGRKLYTCRTVDELLFTGYPDILLTMGKTIVSNEDIPAYDRFGWFYLRNDTTGLDGHYNVATGEEDISQLGIIRKWNHKDTTKFYKSPCNIVEGSAGEFWSPGRTKDDIALFSSDLCRPLIYEYEETVSYLGMEGYRYTLDKKTLENDTRRRYPHEQAKYFEPTTTTEDFFATDSAEMMGITTPGSVSSSDNISENTDEYRDDDPDIINMGHCYCNGECMPSGLMNVTECRYGAPVFVSLPHFYKSDPSLLNQIEGLSPNDKDHSFSITLEPNTGVPLEVTARLQINILLHPSETISLFYNVPKIYLPMFWFSFKGQVHEEMASDLRKLLILPTVMLCTGIAIAVIGLCLIGIVALLFLKKKRRVPVTEPPAEKEVEESSEKKTEMVYLDKVSSEDSNARSDRRLYAKLY
ncbi:protein peste isoform X2 [Linepithema humile]